MMLKFSIWNKMRRSPWRQALAVDEGLDPAEISRLLPLACLSPDIVEAILAGRQPANLTVERLKRLPDLPVEWSKQHQLLG
jgi:hypothetical protein